MAGSTVQHAGRRWIEVRDVDGTPLPGVEVHFFLDQNEHWKEEGFQARLADPRRILPAPYLSHSPSIRTDERGWAGLPEKGYGEAVARVGRREGAVAFPPFEEKRTEPYVLQLAEVRAIRVTVVDSAGQPGVGYRVESQIGTQAELDRKAAQPRRGIEPWRTIGYSEPTDASGQAWVRLDAPESLLEDERYAGQEIRGQVRVALPFAREVTVPVEAEQREVRVQLPPAGFMLVRLHGYPSALRASLRWENPDPSSFGDRAGNGEPFHSEGHSFHFRDVPLDRVFQIRFFRRYAGEPGERDWTDQADFPSSELAGPTLDGERIEHDLYLDLDQAFVGRLLDVGGLPLQPPHPEQWRAQVFGQLAAQPERVLPLQLELEPDGSFRAFPRSSNRRAAERLDAFRALFFEVRPHRGFMRSRGPAEGHGAWLHVPVEVLPGTKEHDLGELQLGAEDPVLVIRVTDAQGEAIPFARCRLESWGRPMQADAEPRWQSIRGEASPQTRQDGELRFAGFSMRKLLPPWEQVVEPLRYRVTVQHPDYLPSEAEFDESTRELHITLQASTQIVGAAVLPEWLNDVSIEAVAAGGEAVPDGARTPSAYLRHADPDPNTGAEPPTEFTIRPVDARSYDLEVVLLRGERFPIGRIPGVQPGSTRDPRLDPLVIADLLQFSMVELILPDGQPLFVPGEGRIRRSFSVEAVDDAGRDLGRYPTLWHKERLLYVMPRGKRLRGRLIVDGCLPVALESLPLGESRLELQAAPRVELNFIGAEDLPAGWELRYAVDTFGLEASRVFPIKEPDGRRFVAIPEPMDFQLRVSVYDAAGEHQFLTRVQLKIDAESFASGGPVDVVLDERFRERLREAGGG